MGILSDSDSLCRLCGLSSPETVDIFSQDGLSSDLCFYLPLEIKASGLFPKRLCDGCHKDFMTLKAFMVRLNEGQALLAEQLVQLDNVVIKVPNLLADAKKSLFKEKYPSAPKVTYSTKVAKNQPASRQLAEILPNKRSRKLPKRLAESVQGNEFEKIFNKAEGQDSSIALEPSSKDEDLHFNQQDEPKTTTIINKSSGRGRHRYKCDICSKVFKLQGRLAHHRSTMHRGAYFECLWADCGKQYKTRESIGLHQKMVSHQGVELIEPGRHICEKCNKSFPSKSSLDTHNLEEHFPGSNMKCSICYESFPSYLALKDHCLGLHGMLKEMACDICSKAFATLSDLYLHTESEHKQMMNVFICKICSRPFKSKNLLSRHLAVVHTDNRPYACHHCDLKFKSSTNLRAHQTMHTGEKKYSCEVCGKLFAYKTSLIQHIRLHDGDKAFECPHCRKRFAQKGNLEEHIRTHTGEKPYVCSLCDRRFTTSSQHKMHEKRHKGEKPWQCDHCPKAFLHKESYKAHIRRHKGEKPYSCEFCSKAFTEIWALKKHKRLHTGEKPYKCKECGKTFADSSNLTKHSKAHVRAGDEITAKDGTVWNIINSAASGATDSDMQQIIYIAYEGEEDGKETAIHVVSQQSQDDLQLTEENPTLHVISQENYGASDFQYVDLSIKDGQQIRLRVPLDADPIQHAKEYLQSLTEEAGSEMLPELE